jgi:hypothetical protein
MPAILTLEKLNEYVSDGTTGRGKSEMTNERTENLRLIVDGNAVGFILDENDLAKETAKPRGEDSRPATTKEIVQRYRRIIAENKWEKVVTVTAVNHPTETVKFTAVSK